MDVKKRVVKDRAVGLWTVRDGDSTYPAASWGEALRFAHGLTLTKQQIVAEEYQHFARLLGPALAKQRLAKVYGIALGTIEKYIREGRNVAASS